MMSVHKPLFQWNNGVAAHNSVFTLIGYLPNEQTNNLITSYLLQSISYKLHDLAVIVEEDYYFSLQICCERTQL